MMTDDNIDASNMVMFRLEATELKVRVLVQTGSGSENGYDVLNSLKVIIFFWRSFLLNYNTLTSISCPLNGLFPVQCVPVPQDAEKPFFLQLQFFYLSIISIAMLEKVPTTQGYRKDTPSPH
jgi:hypothetical protein